MDTTAEEYRILKENLKLISEKRDSGGVPEPLSALPYDGMSVWSSTDNIKLPEYVSETLMKFGTEYNNYLKNKEITTQRNFEEYLQTLINTYSMTAQTRSFPEVTKEDFIEKLDFDDAKYSELKAGLYIEGKFINGSSDNQTAFLQDIVRRAEVSDENIGLYGYILTREDGDNIIYKQKDINTDKRILLFKDIQESESEIFQADGADAPEVPEVPEVPAAPSATTTGSKIKLEPYINMLHEGSDTVNELQSSNSEIISIIGDIIDFIEKFIQTELK